MEVIDITYYTDPLCCWSWGMESAVRKLKDDFATRIRWRNCMGGLLPSWNDFADTVNNVNRPIQMGPVWMHAAQITGTPIDHNIWFRDPPLSSYPPCIAVKAIEAQSPELGDTFLSMIREACLKNGINIGKPEEVIRLVDRLNQRFPVIDLALFKHDFRKGRGIEAFKKDVEETKVRKIKRFPTLILRKAGSEPLITTGYRSYEGLRDVLFLLDPSLKELRIASLQPGGDRSSNEMIA